MMRLLLIGLISLLVLGCTSKTEQNPSFIVTTKVNQASRLENNLAIDVRSVNDSRCPQGCECIWAGEVRVYLNLSDNGNSMDTCLVLPSHPTIQFLNYSVELKDVAPYPICDNQSTPDYIFTFQVSY